MQASNNKDRVKRTFSEFNTNLYTPFSCSCNSLWNFEFKILKTSRLCRNKNSKFLIMGEKNENKKYFIEFS